ncbi:hypothetical protein [Flavobacterium sp. PL02]|uniref:hypothetical protein n=1 Tax=Flavobacterium sp. PL02 TaxID=3088354 RepID=UPI002B223DD4|nr:hypothetical protein [Flavobacterium sp. PL02]MEA9412351.1 hypothetical protein [Flavobacterium sp. PL02]
MKGMKFKMFSVLIVFFVLVSCVSKKNNLTNENFEFVSGNEKVIFEISTGNKYLESNVLTKTKFKFENINPKNVNLSGKTIRILKGNDENELLVEMSPKKEDLENGKLKIFVSYRSNNEFKTFEFEIPVKL